MSNADGKKVFEKEASTIYEAIIPTEFRDVEASTIDELLDKFNVPHLKIVVERVIFHATNYEGDQSLSTGRLSSQLQNDEIISSLNSIVLSTYKDEGSDAYAMGFKKASAFWNHVFKFVNPEA